MNPDDTTEDAEDLLREANILEATLAAVPEDPRNALDARTRAALRGYIRGVRTAVRALRPDV